MISTEEARKIIMNNLFAHKSEVVGIGGVLGRITDEKIVADRDFPPFNRVMMDGIAIAFSDFDQGVREYNIENRQLAGSPGMVRKEDSGCLEVMTGAVLPQNTDTVLKIEDVIIADDKAIVNTTSCNKGQNVHLKGADRRTGSVLMEKGVIIEPKHVSILSTVGKKDIKVKTTPKIAIISTGDELVEVDRQPLDYQIRMSNSYVLSACLKEMNIPSDSFHLNDDFKALEKRISQLLNEYDCLLISGGVSKGKKDYLPEVLEKLHVEKLFHRVKQRPGKPFWFGKNDQATVFAFPGNPVSVFMCFHKYFKEWMHNSFGLKVKVECAVLKNDINFNPELTYYVQVKLEQDRDSRWVAHVKEGAGSGDLANLLRADAFMELPAGKQDFNKGEVYPVIRF